MNQCDRCARSGAIQCSVATLAVLLCANCRADYREWSMLSDEWAAARRANVLSILASNRAPRKETDADDGAVADQWIAAENALNRLAARWIAAGPVSL